MIFVHLHLDCLRHKKLLFLKLYHLSFTIPRTRKECFRSITNTISTRRYYTACAIPRRTCVAWKLTFCRRVCSTVCFWCIHNKSCIVSCINRRTWRSHPSTWEYGGYHTRASIPWSSRDTWCYRSIRNECCSVTKKGEGTRAIRKCSCHRPTWSGWKTCAVLTHITWCNRISNRPRNGWGTRTWSSGNRTIWSRECSRSCYYRNGCPYCSTVVSFLPFENRSYKRSIIISTCTNIPRTCTWKCVWSRSNYRAERNHIDCWGNRNLRSKNSGMVNIIKLKKHIES